MTPITPPPPMRLDASATAEALPWAPLVRALRAMLESRRRGAAHAPDRLVVPLDGGTLLVMPARDDRFAITKLVTIHPTNPMRGLPSLLGEVLLMRADTGERLLVLDGPTLTARRTAALSALAAGMLAPDVSGPMLIVGAGPQARAHLEAFTAVRGVRRVVIASRTLAGAEALAAQARALGVDAIATVDPSGHVAQAGIIVTATSSLSAVIDDRVRAGAFVAAVGAFRPEMCELPASLLQRAPVFVDDLDGARHEAGDLIQAGIDWNQVRPLEHWLDVAAATGREAPVVFKSVGHALWDLAAARLAAGA